MAVSVRHATIPAEGSVDAVGYTQWAEEHTVTGVELAGAAAAAVAAHEAAPDPHPQYLTSTEGNAAYAAVGHNHAGTYEPVDATILRSAAIGVSVAAQSHTHAATDVVSGTFNTARLGSGTANSGVFLRGDSTWAAPTASVALSSASVAFTDGDTARRVTVTDASVASTSKVVLTVRRPDTADDSADPGYIYTANVVRVGTGSFDVFLSVFDISGNDITEMPPNETIQLHYMVAA